MKSLILLAACFFLACNDRPSVDYDIIENKKYDIPVKSQISKRIVLKDSVGRELVKEIILYEFREAMSTRMDFHNPPSHVFVYVYAPGTDVVTQSGNWLAMKQRIMNETKEVEFAD